MACSFPYMCMSFSAAGETAAASADIYREGAAPVTAPVALAAADVRFEFFGGGEKHVGREIADLGIAFPETVRGPVHTAEPDTHTVARLEVFGSVGFEFRVERSAAIDVGGNAA